MNGRTYTGRARRVGSEQPGIDRRINGIEFREIRKRCGWRAGELAELLAEEGAPITTARSVYNLEALREVPSRYVDALRTLVGEVNFDRVLRALDEEAQRRKEYY